MISFNKDAIYELIEVPYSDNLLGAKTKCKSAFFDLGIMSNNLLHKIIPFIELARLDKPVGFLLLLWPCLFSLSLFPFDGLFIGIFILGSFLTRALGCVVNDIADRDFDLEVKRTAARPLATGELSLAQACCFAFFLAVAALSLLVFLPLKTCLLALVAALSLAVYPFSKRFFWFPQVFLGIAFSMPVLMVFSLFEWPLSQFAWLLFLVNFCWVVGYDSIYALADLPFDEKLRIHSSVKSLRAKHRIVFISLCYAATCIFLWIFCSLWFENSSIALFVAFPVACFFSWQLKALRRIQPDDIAGFLRLFKANNFLGVFLVGVFFIFSNSFF